MAMWMHPYFITDMEVDSVGKIWLTTGYKIYHYNYEMNMAVGQDSLVSPVHPICLRPKLLV